MTKGDVSTDDVQCLKMDAESTNVANREGDHSALQHVTKPKVTVLFRNTDSAMPQLDNSQESGLRRSKLLFKDKPELVDGNYLYNFFTNFINFSNK